MDETADGRSYRVQDLGIGDALDHALYLLRDHWKPLLFIVCVVGLPFYAVAAAVQAWATPANIDALATGTAGAEDIQPGDFVYLALVPMAMSFLLYVIGLPLMAAAITHQAAMAYFGAPVRAGESVRMAFRRFPKLVVSAFLYGVAVFVGSMLCIIPGFLAQCAFFLYIPLIVLEDTSLSEVFSRSMRLMKGYMWACFLLIIAMNLFSFFVGGASALLQNYDLQSALGYGAGVFAGAMQTLVATVLYCAARCRHEHLDLDLAAQRVDDAVAAPAL